VQVQIPVRRENRHGVEQAHKCNCCGVFDRQADTILRARRATRDALEKEDKQAAEEGRLEETVEEDLESEPVRPHWWHHSHLSDATDSSNAARAPLAARLAYSLNACRHA
jgi:hypothetical protein